MRSITDYQSIGYPKSKRFKDERLEEYLINIGVQCSWIRKFIDVDSSIHSEIEYHSEIPFPSRISVQVQALTNEYVFHSALRKGEDDDSKSVPVEKLIHRYNDDIIRIIYDKLNHLDEFLIFNIPMSAITVHGPEFNHSYVPVRAEYVLEIDLAEVLAERERARDEIAEEVYYSNGYEEEREDQEEEIPSD